MFEIKIKVLIIFILAMVSDLITVKNITTLKANTPHKCEITWQPQVHPPVMPQGRLQKIPILLCRKITKPVGNQTHGKTGEMNQEDSDENDQG